MNLLEDPLIQALIARLIQPGVIGLAVTGSYARGEQDQHSDVDVDIFIDSLPEDGYKLRILNGKLVSLKYIRLQDEHASLTKPESAVWAVPGLRQLRILVDETGRIAKLQQAAYDFNWSELQAAANDYAVKSLGGCSEEAHKIIGGLLQENESKVLYAAWGMFKNLPFAAAVQAGLMIESENRIFSMMQEHFSNNPGWVRAFRMSFGMDVTPDLPPYQVRGKAALDLYEQTALLFEKIMTDEHREVIGNTLQLIAAYKEHSPHD